MLTNCPINKETLRQAPGLQNWPVRGHWPLRALPGRPLGGGRVLGLHVLGCLLSLFKTQGHGLRLELRQSGGEGKGNLGSGAVCFPWSKMSLFSARPLLPIQLPRTHSAAANTQALPPVHSEASGWPEETLHRLAEIG